MILGEEDDITVRTRYLRNQARIRGNVLEFLPGNCSQAQRLKHEARLDPGGARATGDQPQMAGPETQRAGPLCALDLPGSEASEMEMVRIHSGQRPIARVPDYEFQLISDHGPAADAANGTNPMTAPYPVGIMRRHLPETDRFTGLFSDEGFIGHMLLRRIVWLSTMMRERVNCMPSGRLLECIAPWDVTPQRPDAMS